MHSHLRFLDKINGEKVWLDIINDDVECPTNKEGVVDIKIVQQFHTDSQAFMNDFFNNIQEHNYNEIVHEFREKCLSSMLTAPNLEHKINSQTRNSGRKAKATKNSRGFDSDDLWTKSKDEGYQKFEDKEEIEENEEFDETEEINEDADKFDINFNETDFDTKTSDKIDFLNDTVDPSFVPKPRKESNEMKEFANLLDSKPTQTTSKTGGILNLDFGSSPNSNTNTSASKSKGKTTHEIQIDAQQQKLKFANELDPVISEWSKDPSTGTVKDIRSLLISLQSFLKTYNIKFDKIMLSQVMSKGAVRKMYFKVIRKIHPDKTNETDPKILYMFERMTEIINNAFKKHKSMA
jgi:hypothetical protein